MKRNPASRVTLGHLAKPGLSGLCAGILLCAAQPALSDYVDGEGFGIRAGTPLSQLSGWPSASADPSTRIVGLDSVPKPHPLLTWYHLRESAETGACAISGTAEPKLPATSDDLLQTLRRELVEALGEPDEHAVRTRRRKPSLPAHAFGGPDVQLRQESFLWVRTGLTRTVKIERDVWSTGPVVSLSFEFANLQECERGGGSPAPARRGPGAR